MPKHSHFARQIDTQAPKPLLITTGEPAGIGMDIVIDVLCHHRDVLERPLWILANILAFEERIRALMAVGKIHHAPDYQVFHQTSAEVLPDASLGDVVLWHIGCAESVIAGQLSVKNAQMVYKQLSLAHQLAQQQCIGAIVTAPIQKSVMIQAGITLDDGEMFSGHTEFFMQKSGCDKVVMMLANRVMQVALVTTHLPLRCVADAITSESVRRTVEITHRALVQQFGIKSPRILVCGLNPHAGEDGHLGNEEQQIINPVLEQFQHQGMNISLAMPADTLFTPRHLAATDAVIAMYHDQGLAPLKSHGFGETVNITLGLPYIRTSVDHGTALDLAGSGQASSSSLLQAIRQAQQMLHATAQCYGE